MSEAALWKRHIGLLKHVFLALLLGLLAYNLNLLLQHRESSTSRLHYVGLIIGLALLINHLAMFYINRGWPGKVMTGISLAWVSFALIYTLLASR